jgi:hypothetical protein
VIKLSTGNSKLGRIHNWSLPAVKSCPGASELCKSLCYATRYRFRNEFIVQIYRRNFRASRRPDFATRMAMAIEQANVRILRIHASGDFFSAKYVRAWIRISDYFPDVVFYAYTRSWARARLLPALTELGRRPNVHLWFSGDRDMPAPPRRKGIRRCYLSSDDTDCPSWDADLVFRNRPRLPIKRMGAMGALVCPVEQAVPRQAERITCESCQLCFNPEKAAAVLDGGRSVSQSFSC